MKKTRFPRPDPKRLADFRALKERLDKELEEAASLDRVLRDTPIESWPILAELPELQTCGSLHRLGKLVTDEVTRDPQRARAIAELAVSLSEALPPHTYPAITTAQVRANAYRNLSTTLRYLGHVQEAIDTLAVAEKQLGDFGSLEHDRAIIRFSLAATLQELQRYEESTKLLNECKEVFAFHRDDRRFMLCALAEAALFQRMSKFREARETYLLLLTSDAVTLEDRAAIHRSIGLCSIELGQFLEAETNLIRGATLHRDLGQPLDSLKAETGLGRLYIRRGQLERGIAHLRPIRRKFLQAGLAEEAGICALEIIEAMLQLEKPSDAEQLARLVVHEFVSAKLSARAITALGYLTEAISKRTATVTLVANVLEYIVSLRTEPEREFTLAV